MAYNNISVLAYEVFAGLNNLTSLNLSGNPLRTFTGGLSNTFSSLVTLDATGTLHWKPEKKMLQLRMLNNITGLSWSAVCKDCSFYRSNITWSPDPPGVVGYRESSPCFTVFESSPCFTVFESSPCFTVFESSPCFTVFESSPCFTVFESSPCFTVFESSPVQVQSMFYSMPNALLKSKSQQTKNRIPKRSELGAVSSHMTAQAWTWITKLGITTLESCMSAQRKGDLHK
ncbi:hypothetical protein QZH41_007254 [Actinostola sp. cb2023]|nr:hypothetical protein QZH41_007254 [Actinostola sp. cb2023]